MYSGGSGLSIDIHFVDIELSYDVLSPFPIVLSKHFNHPHPYIEITTVISDYQFSTSLFHSSHYLKVIVLTLLWHMQHGAHISELKHPPHAQAMPPTHIQNAIVYKHAPHN